MSDPLRTFVNDRHPVCSACELPHRADLSCPSFKTIDFYQRRKRKTLTKDNSKKRVLKAKGPAGEIRIKKRAPGHKRTWDLLRKASRKPAKRDAAKLIKDIQDERHRVLEAVHAFTANPDQPEAIAHAKKIWAVWLTRRLKYPDAKEMADWADIIEAECEHLRGSYP